jgi:hypothetical protein
MTGIERIAAERKRQIEEEGFTAEHDDKYDYPSLALAAACYALPPDVRKSASGVGGLTLIKQLWPFGDDCWKPTPENRIRELEKGGALIAAEIERLDRLEKNEA